MSLILSENGNYIFEKVEILEGLNFYDQRTNQMKTTNQYSPVTLNRVI